MGIKKVFSTVLAAVFLFTFTARDFAYAAAPDTHSAVQNYDISGNVFGSFARLTSSADFGGDTVVLNIQDFHMHPEVQKNISSVIDILVKQYGIGSVFVEGAYGKVNTDMLSRIKDENFKISVIDNLLESGTLTGAEYYAAINGKKDFIFGLEDEKIHKDNIQRLGNFLDKKSGYGKDLALLRDELNFFQAKYFNSKNKRLTALVEKHKSGKITSAKYYAILFNYLKKNAEQSESIYGTVMPMDIGDYPNISMFLNIDKLQKSLNIKKASKEMQQLISGLKETLSYTEYTKLLETTNDLSDTYMLSSYLSNLPDEFKEKHFTGEISKFIDISNKYAKINPVDLITEERLLVEEIRIALSLNKNELEVSFLSDFFLYFSDYLETSISAADYAYFQSKFGKFQTLWDKYSFYNKTMYDLRADFEALNEYYAVNDLRNEIFINNISRVTALKSGKNIIPAYNEPAAKLLKGKKNIIVCVTGGYHSKGLSEILASKNISYAVITPGVNGEIGNALLNYEVMAAEQAKIFSQGLALSLFSQIVSHAAAGNNAEAKRFAAQLFISAAQTLEDIPFNSENINTLVSQMNEFVGADYKFSFNQESGEVSFSSADGKYSESFIQITRTPNGSVAIKNEYSLKSEDKVMLKGYGRLFNAEAMKEFMGNLAQVLQITSLDFGTSAFAPKMYSSGVHIINHAAKHNLFLDINAINGISFEMAQHYGLDDEILFANPQVAKYGERWQNATVLSNLREKDFKNGNMSDLTKMLFATNLVNEFLPITHDTLMMYDKYPTALNATILNEVETLRNGERLDYSVMPEKPGTAGVRGAIGEVLTITSAQIIAQAQANLALKDAKPGERPLIVIGSDTRYGGTEFKKAIAGVFLANGFRVQMFEENIPTPLISYYTKKLGCIAVNVTGSHNKGTDNGYKFTINGAQAPDQYGRDLVTEMESLVASEVKGIKAVKYQNPEADIQNGTLELPNVAAIVDDYSVDLLAIIAEFFNMTSAELVSTIQKESEGAPFSIFEANNGTAGVLLGRVYDEFRIDKNNVKIIHENRDTTYRGKSPEPNESNLGDLKEEMEKEKDARPGQVIGGYASDVDADRIGTILYYENGEMNALTPNEIALIMQYAIMEYTGGKVPSNSMFVRTQATTHALDVAASLFGIKVESTNVGSKYLAEKIDDKNNNVLLAAESSGTILLGSWLLDKDGIMANLLTYLIPIMTKKTYSEILNEIYEKIGYRISFVETKAQINSTEDKNDALDFFKNATDEEILELIDLKKIGTNARLVRALHNDGIYVGFASDETDAILKSQDVGTEIIWLQMRGSGTENAMRVYAESHDPKITDYLVEAGKNIAQGGFKNLRSDKKSNSAPTSAESAAVSETGKSLATRSTEKESQNINSKKLVFVGPPFAGKGTSAAIISEALGIPHVSTGDMFRANSKKAAELRAKKANGETLTSDEENMLDFQSKVESFMNRGMLVPDEIVNEVVFKRVLEPDFENGFILDGYPRTLQQAQAFDKFLEEKGIIVEAAYIDAEKKTIEERLIKRIEDDRAAGRPIRNDDNPETLAVRLEIFAKDTMPIVEYYKSKSRLAKYNVSEIEREGSLNPSESIADSIIKKLDGIKDSAKASEVSLFESIKVFFKEFINNRLAYRFLSAMKGEYEKRGRDSSIIDRLWTQYEMLSDGSMFSPDGMTVQEIIDSFWAEGALAEAERVLNEMKYGTAGYRAEFGERLNYVHILTNAQAIAEVAKARFSAAKNTGREKAKIFIGYDTRFMSKEFSEIIAGVFAANGVEAELSVVDTPTPAISWKLGNTKGKGYDLAVNITASHNPFEYDGIKVNEPFGGQAGGDITEAIEKKIAEIAEGKIKIKYSNLETGFDAGNIILNYNLKDEYIAAYIESFKKQFNINSEADFEAFKKNAHKFFFVVDVKSGTTPEYYKEIMDALGITNYEIINDEFDPTFGGEDPNPDKNTAQLKARVEAIMKANPDMFVYGLSTDPDGDRMAVIENGKTFTTDEMIIYNQYMLLEKAAQTAKAKGKKQEVVIAVNFATTGAVESIKEYFEKKYPDLLDIKVVRTNIGFKWIAEVLKEAKDRNPDVITMGAEESGAIVVGGLTLDKDGLVATFGSVCLAIDADRTIDDTLKYIYADVLGWMPDKKMHSIKLGSMADLSAKRAFLKSVAEDEDVKSAFISNFNHLNEDFKIERIEQIVGTSFEGIQIFTNNSKLLIIMRLSGTEPLVKIYAESDSGELTDAIIDAGNRILLIPVLTEMNVKGANSKNIARSAARDANLLSAQEKESVYARITELYDAEGASFQFNESWGNMPGESRYDSSIKYQENGTAKPASKEEITLNSFVENGALVNLLAESAAKIQKFNEEKQKEKGIKYFAVVPESAYHITLWDSAAFNYNDAAENPDIFNQKTRDEIKQEIKNSEAVKDRALSDSEKEKIISSYIAQKIKDVIAELENEGLFNDGFPNFVPDTISAFGPNGFNNGQKFVVTVRMKPATAGDLIKLMAIQQRLVEATGYEDYPAFNGHITLFHPLTKFTDKKDYADYIKTLEEVNENIKKSNLKTPLIPVITRFSNVEDFEVVSGGDLFDRGDYSVRSASIEDIDIAPGQKFLVRVDYNVPTAAGKITDDTRIQGTLETIKYITDRGGKVILMSHFGRPDGKVVADMSLAPVAAHLSGLLRKEVLFLDDAIGENNSAAVDAMENGGVVLLENVRFYAQEEKNDDEFAKQLAANAGSDAVFVMDAFGAAHRAHSSTVGISKYVSRSVAGLLMSKELQFLGSELEKPQSPSVAIIGGSKVKDKIGVIEALLKKTDKILIGGAMAYSFLAAQGKETGASAFVDEGNVNSAKDLLKLAASMKKEIILPVDHVAVKEGTYDFGAKKLDKNEIPVTTKDDEIEAGYMALDIGPKTIEIYGAAISDAKTIIWNGPMGAFEHKSFANGSIAVAEAMAKATKENGAVSIVGGGDSVAAVNLAGMAEAMSHVSTGGGASLEFLEKGTLPAVESLDSVTVYTPSDGSSKSPKLFWTHSLTVENYLREHRFVRWIYNNLSIPFATAIIAISPAKLGAPRAELAQMASAIAAKIAGDDRELQTFIDMHAYSGEARQSLAAGMDKVTAVVSSMIDKGASPASINRAILRMHFANNIKAAASTLFRRIANIFSDKESDALVYMMMGQNFNTTLSQRLNSPDVMELRNTLFDAGTQSSIQLNSAEAKAAREGKAYADKKAETVKSSRMIFFGQPLSGKSSAAKLISAVYGIPEISTGDLLLQKYEARAKEIAQRQQNGAKLTAEEQKMLDIINTINEGGLVDDETVIELVRERLLEDDTKNGFILDGFPRTVRQAEALEKMLFERNEFITPVLIDADLPTVQERGARLFSEESSADDTPEAINARYENYLKYTLPVIEHYRNKGILAEFKVEDIDVRHPSEIIAVSILERIIAINEIDKVSNYKADNPSYTRKLAKPDVLANGLGFITPEAAPTATTDLLQDTDVLRENFPNTYGQPVVNFKAGKNNAVSSKTLKTAVMFSGGPASGGNNVIAGIYDALKGANANNEIYGVYGGPGGLLNDQWVPLSDDMIDQYRNTGGFDLIGTGRAAISDKELAIMQKNLEAQGITSLVIIGGDGSNTLAGIFAEYLKKNNSAINVIGVPKTLDGDVKFPGYVETSFGFDTGTKTYAATVSNLAIDARSTGKYWHAVKVMGRNASHVTLEVALQTRPNIALISEEILDKKLTLSEVVESMVKSIVDRSNAGRNYGIILIPEGLFDFIPEIRNLIEKLNELYYANYNKPEFEKMSPDEKLGFMMSSLPKENTETVANMPIELFRQLALDRDVTGKIHFSRIKTESILMDMVEKRLDELKNAGKYNGDFEHKEHFVGYEGRSTEPSNFDNNYAYALGFSAAALLANDYTGYMAYVSDLQRTPKHWKAGGVPLTSLMTEGSRGPRINQHLVDLNGPAFSYFSERRDKWSRKDDYQIASGVHFGGAFADTIPVTLQHELKTDKTKQSPVNTSEWQSLKRKAASDMMSKTLSDMFAADPDRAKKLTKRLNSMLIDFSKNRVDDETINLLLKLAKESQVIQEANNIMNGKQWNWTEQRAVLHTALRNMSDTPVYVDGKDVMPQIKEVLQKIKKFSEDVIDGTEKSVTGQEYTDLVCVGIGGSDLGPRMVVEALAKMYGVKIKIHFVSNVDPAAVQQLMSTLNPATTLVIVQSKTFGTQETLQNAGLTRLLMAIGMLEYDKNGKLLRGLDGNVISSPYSEDEDSKKDIKRIFGFNAKTARLWLEGDIPEDYISNQYIMEEGTLWVDEMEGEPNPFFISDHDKQMLQRRAWEKMKTLEGIDAERLRSEKRIEIIADILSRQGRVISAADLDAINAETDVEKRAGMIADGAFLNIENDAERQAAKAEMVNFMLSGKRGSNPANISMYAIELDELAVREYEWFLNMIEGAFLQELADFIVEKQFVAVSTAEDKVRAFGINTDNMFGFWDFVGGRYSVWSAVGLPIAIAIGFENFEKFLSGAYEMDKHFANTDYQDNIPVLMAMIWLWYVNFLGFDNHAVLPYSEDLKLFTKYLQQLIMESLGKRADVFGNVIDEYSTGPAIFGEPGTDSQHSFFQQLHMGTGIIPGDFITFMKSSGQTLAEKTGNQELIKMENDSQNIFFANFLAQTQALAFGRSDEEVKNDIEKEKVKKAAEMKTSGKSDKEIEEEMDRLDRLVAQKLFDGNRPTTSIVMDELNPENLGMLIALYEHMVMVMSIVWRIDAYDQFGVELGKSAANKLLDSIRNDEQSGELVVPEDADSSTRQLLEEFSAWKSKSDDDGNQGSAIMEKNYPKVVGWLMNGNSVFMASLKLSFTENFPSMNIFKFAAGHSEKNQAVAKKFSIFALSVTVISGIVALAALPYSLVASVAIVAIGFFAKIAMHMRVDYKYIRKMSEDINKYGNVPQGKSLEDLDYLEVLVFNEVPLNPESLGFKNTGIKADGKILWASKKTGKLILLADKADFNNIALSASEIMPAVLNKKGSGFEISAIAVDDNEALSKNINYFDDLLVVKKSFYDEIVKISGGDLIVAGESIRKEKEAEQNAFAKNFVMDLSFIKSSNDDIKKVLSALSAYNKTGNYQMAIPYSFLENMAEIRFNTYFKNASMTEAEKARTLSSIMKNLVTEWSADGVRLFMVIEEDMEDKYNFKGKLLEYGFAGFIERQKGDKAIFKDFYSDSETTAEDISGFKTQDELVSMIAMSGQDSTKIINIENYINLITTGERDITSKIGDLVGLFGNNIFKFFNREITAEYVYETVLNMSMDTIPAVDVKILNSLPGFIANYEDAKNALSRAAGNASIRQAEAAADKARKELLAELNKMNAQNLSVELKILSARIADNASGASGEDIEISFLTAIAQKAKVKADLYSKYPLGFENKELEKFFVRCALSPYTSDTRKLQTFERSITRVGPDGRYELSLSATEVFEAAELQSKELVLRDKYSTATAYELLLKHAEKKTKAEVKKQTGNFDAKAVAVMLAAA